MYKNEFGWSTKAWSKDKANNKCYLSFNFPMGMEPNGTEYEFEMYIEGTDGKKYPTYVGTYTKKDGSQHPTIKVKEPTSCVPKANNRIEINNEDLPF